MPFPEIDPGRLEALLAGRAAPETPEERETLALLSALERDGPDARARGP